MTLAKDDVVELIRKDDDGGRNSDNRRFRRNT
jgi:hypothetical protein